MSRSDVLQLCQDLSTNQSDADAIDKFYDDVVSDLGRGDWLVTTDVLAATAGTAQYNPVSTIVELRGVWYDDRWLYKESLRSIEALNPNWRDERGTPRAYIIEDETNLQFRLYPRPAVDSKTPGGGEEMGLEFPEYSVVVLMTEIRETLPAWLELPVAFEILAREFGRESDHHDPTFAKSCKEISQMLLKMVGP